MLEMNIDDLIEYVYDRLEVKVDKETLAEIFALETDYMVEIGIIEIEE